MESCDKCQGGDICAAVNLQPLLDHAYRMHQRGLDKMQILLAVDDDLEILTERHTRDVRPACWTKAALLRIAAILADGLRASQADDSGLENLFRGRIRRAAAAFELFPWALGSLDSQSMAVYGRLEELVGEDELRHHMSPRAFRKICSDIAVETR